MTVLPLGLCSECKGKHRKPRDILTPATFRKLAAMVRGQGKATPSLRFTTLKWWHLDDGSAELIEDFLRARANESDADIGMLSLILEMATNDGVFGPVHLTRAEGMHYANGKEASVGDKVVGKNASHEPMGGTVNELEAGAETCNAQVTDSHGNVHCCTCSDLVLLEDALDCGKPEAESAE